DVVRAMATPQDVTASMRPVQNAAVVWSVLALSVLGIMYLGYRAFVPAQTLGAVSAQSLDEVALRQRVVAPVATPHEEPQPVVTPVVAPAPIGTQQQQPPAHVMLRSAPGGATVLREGKKLGETPLELLVKPEEEFVRVELRHDGFLPLTAELTARE